MDIVRVGRGEKEKEKEEKTKVKVKLDRSIEREEFLVDSFFSRLAPKLVPFGTSLRIVTTQLVAVVFICVCANGSVRVRPFERIFHFQVLAGEIACARWLH